MEKLYEYKRLGFSLVVYPNRIAIIDSSKNFIAPKKTDILLKSITSINIVNMSRTLELTMTDGSLRKIPIFGKDAEKLKDVILEML